MVLVFLLGSVALLVIDGALTARREIELFELDAEEDSRSLGRLMQTIVGDVWRRHGQEEALRLMAEVDRHRPLFAIRWIAIDEDSHALQARGIDLGLMNRLRSGEEVVLHPGDSGETLVSYFPVRVQGDRLGVIELTESLSHVESANRRAITRIGLLTLGLAGLAIVLAVPVGLRIVGRRLDQLIEQTRRIGLGDYSNRLHLEGRDELAEVANALNSMSDRLAKSRSRLLQESEARVAAIGQLRHEDRLRTVGQLAAGLAHELGTPLNVVLGRADLIMKQRLGEEEVIHAAENIKAQARSMTKIVQQLLDFARLQAPKKSTTRPEVLAREVIDLLRPLANKKQATLELVHDTDTGAIEADRSQIRQVLTNLLMNSIQAANPSSSIRVHVKRSHAQPPEDVDSESDEFLCLVVEDDGRGIPGEDLPHLFEPFFTTKDVGQGTGLGLSIAHGIVREHGGWIHVSSRLGKGSRFSVYLPLEKTE